MEKLELEIQCPNCNRKLKQRLEDMRSGRSRRCSFCGAEIKFTGDGARQVQRALDDLKDSLKRLGGN